MNSKITTIPINFIGIEDSGYHIVIKLRANKKTVNLLLDTGASRTAFDKNRFIKINKSIKSEVKISETKSVGLGTNSMESELSSLNEFKLGRLIINDYEAVLLDLSIVNEAYKALNLAEIDGVLGSDILFKYNAKIDFKKKKLTLHIT